jgi:hypothetical protein
MQAISLIMSGLMLGLKVAHVMAVPALWKKLDKWRSVARPLREAADLGTELRHSAAQPELTEEEYIEGLQKLQEAVTSWAAKPVPAGLKAGTKMQAALEKTAQVFAVLINEANALTERPDAPPSSSPQVPPPFPPVYQSHPAAHARRLRAHCPTQMHSQLSLACTSGVCDHAQDRPAH